MPHFLPRYSVSTVHVHHSCCKMMITKEGFFFSVCQPIMNRDSNRFTLAHLKEIRRPNQLCRLFFTYQRNFFIPVYCCIYIFCNSTMIHDTFSVPTFFKLVLDIYYILAHRYNNSYAITIRQSNEMVRYISKNMSACRINCWQL